MDEFYLLPECVKLYKYDCLAINVIVNNRAGGISSCDIPYTDDLDKFCSDYMFLTQSASTSCQSSFVDDAMVIGTSAMTETELDCIVNQYTDQFCNPMVMWGRYRKGWLRTTLPISFQFHHVQMDGGHAARFLDELQKTITLYE
jgi:chloramphenicol O-acetyltransferase type A